MPFMADLRIEVVYALPDREEALTVRLPQGATVADAVRASGILARYPHIDIARQPLGIYGKRVASSTPLANGDRVEIYRPLEVDPKEARRRRAAKAR
jgi:putative ubiquitin-RnfH superfamily antitoxin RatB of RatAB toxin-antitoxin module